MALIASPHMGLCGGWCGFGESAIRAVLFRRPINCLNKAGLRLAGVSIHRVRIKGSRNHGNRPAVTSHVIRKPSRPSLELEDASWMKASAKKIGKAQGIAERAAAPVDPRLRPNRFHEIR